MVARSHQSPHHCCPTFITNCESVKDVTLEDDIKGAQSIRLSGFVQAHLELLCVLDFTIHLGIAFYLSPQVVRARILLWRLARHHLREASRDIRATSMSFLRNNSSKGSKSSNLINRFVSLD